MFPKGVATFTTGSTTVSNISMSSGDIASVARGTRLDLGVLSTPNNILEAIDRDIESNTLELREPFTGATAVYSFKITYTNDGLREAAVAMRDTRESMVKLLDGADSNATSGTLAIRDDNANIKVGTAEQDEDAVNKLLLETEIAKISGKVIISTEELATNKVSVVDGTVWLTQEFRKGSGKGAGYWLKLGTTTESQKLPEDTKTTTISDAIGQVWELVTDRPEVTMVKHIETAEDINTALDILLNHYGKANIDGDYVFSSEVLIDVDDVEVIFNGVIRQSTWGLSCVQVRADNVTLITPQLLCEEDKTQLSTTVATRYEGNVSRARCSAVYAKQANNLLIKNPYLEGFVNGVYLNGYAYNVWRTNLLDRTFTNTTFELAEEDRQDTDDFYVGATIRILSDTQATANVVVSAYNSATNTVTFEQPQTSFEGLLNYYLLLGRATIATVTGMRGDRIDFGVCGAGYNKVLVTLSDFGTIEQTQETNARPHLTYLTSHCEDVTYSHNRVRSCENGAMLKIRGGDVVVLEDNHAYKSRGIAEVESCNNVTALNNTSYNAGEGNPEFGVYGVRFTNCNTITERNTILQVSGDYDKAGKASQRPIASWYYSDKDSNVGQSIGVFNNRIQNATSENSTIIVGNNVDHHYAVMLEGNDSDVPMDTVEIINPLVVSEVDDATIKPARVINAENVTIQNPKVQGVFGSVNVQTDDSTVTIVQFQDKIPILGGSNTTNINLVEQETSTFSPELKGNTTVGNNAYLIQTGQSVRTGNVVTVGVRLRMDGAIDSTGYLYIDGLPFPPAKLEGASTGSSAVVTGFSNVTIGTDQTLICISDGNSGRLYLYKLSNTGTTNLLGSDVGSGFELQLQLTYIA